MNLDPPDDDGTLERLLRDNRSGPPGPGEVTPWDFVRQWPDAYVSGRVWPIVSRLLADGDAVVRARSLEFLDGWAEAAKLGAPRLVELAERHADLFGDESVNGVSLRERMLYALSNVANWADGPRIAQAIWKVGADAPMSGGPAQVLARFEPGLAGDHARRWGAASLDGIRAAAETIAKVRRDALVDFLTQLRALPDPARRDILATVDAAIYRDDAKAALATRTYALPPPRLGAPSTDELARALGLQ